MRYVHERDASHQHGGCVRFQHSHAWGDHIHYHALEVYGHVLRVSTACVTNAVTARFFCRITPSAHLIGIVYGPCIWHRMHHNQCNAVYEKV